MTNLSVPLGVAHRRELLAKAGDFDTRPWFAEDWELWKRLARCGAEFVFLPIKSGLYHSEKTSLTHTWRLSEAQRADFEQGRRDHDRLFPAQIEYTQREVVKLVFASPHAIIDPSSGAAVVTNEALQLLSQSGFQCQAFTAARLDFPEEVCVEEMLAKLGLPYEFRTVLEGNEKAKVLLTRRGNLPVTMFRNRFTQIGPTEPEVAAFATAYERFLHKNEPDAILTYGGAPLGTILARLARRRDIAVVFALHNFAYANVAPFHNVDYAVVPSQFSKAYYWERLGLHCQVLPNIVDPNRVVAADRQPQYLTLVNPHPVKGLYVFARIAEQIARRRPDIPILVVDSRGRGKGLEQTGLDLSWAKKPLFHGQHERPAEVLPRK